MKYTWWIFQILMSAVCCFFFVFGIDLLISAYQLKDPFSFIMTFFSSSFIILISLTLFISFIIKMVRVYRQIKEENSAQDQQ